MRILWIYENSLDNAFYAELKAEDIKYLFEVCIEKHRSPLLTPDWLLRE